MSVIPSALPWASALIQAAGQPIPDYGSAEWAALPDGSRAKVAACVIAAECWRTYTDPAEVALRLRIELDAARDYEEPAVWSPEIVAEVRRTADRPTFAELCERRGEPERAARARESAARMREVA
ncbi:hypothetical protein E9549_08160 [Blastococcus sp. MG754426]|uniref:hypothetical protein n=1 Tax=unclassified Blastococcus TaxID=2619396 RepID=UPI001EEFA0E4|nr:MULTISPECIES: hypothetical protein [unclassified Blastococcus]MCF6507380.1 hypothetical protein [Blastococcus sp. MG754426]MCF6511452.1 hypothetical protein [Blastococcus sp. MG754427]